jgi:hypothetical protein
MALAASPQVNNAGPLAVRPQTVLQVAGAFPGIINLGGTDPSMAPGVLAPMGSLGLRNTGAAGQLWIKTGAANIAWTLQVTP